MLNNQNNAECTLILRIKKNIIKLDLQPRHSGNVCQSVFFVNMRSDFRSQVIKQRRIFVIVYFYILKSIMRF